MADETIIEVDAAAADAAEPEAVEAAPEAPEPVSAPESEPEPEPEPEGPVYTPELVAELIEHLSGASRRRRQEVGFEIAAIAHTAPELLEEYIDALIDALYRPEAQTRWEVLDALTQLASLYGEKTYGAFEGAEMSLFDEDSATVRLTAFLFLCRYGASAPERSDEAWPILDEAIQCFHGDAEFHDMLGGLRELAQGELSPACAKALADRVGFDAENGTSFIKTYSAEIIKSLKERMA